MANETTTTVYADRILPELISEHVQKASKARIVALPHCNFDSIDGQPTKTKSYPRYANLGVAASATEGTPISTITELSMGTQLSLTVSEGATAASEVTTDAIERKMPGFSGQAILDAVNSGSDPRVLAIFAEEYARHLDMVMDKVESDVLAKLDDFSTVVGSTGVDFSLSLAEQALYQLTNKETGNESRWVFLLAPIHISDLRNEIAISSGGASGSIWSTDVQSIVMANPAVEVNGLVGMLYGVPCYQTATSLNPSPNSGADEAGALLVSGGGGSPSDDDGALMFLEGSKPKHAHNYGALAREATLVTTYEYAVGERADDMGISIIADA